MSTRRTSVRFCAYRKRTAYAANRTGCRGRRVNVRALDEPPRDFRGMGAEAWPPQDSEGNGRPLCRPRRFSRLEPIRDPDRLPRPRPPPPSGLRRRRVEDGGAQRGVERARAGRNAHWRTTPRDALRDGPRGTAARHRPSPTGPISAAAARRGVDPRGRTLSFGRYADWTVSELAAHDPDYLEWLARAPAGLTFRQEIYTELAKRPAAYPGRTATATRQAQSRSRFGRPRLW